VVLRFGWVFGGLLGGCRPAGFLLDCLCLCSLSGGLWVVWFGWLIFSGCLF